MTFKVESNTSVKSNLDKLSQILFKFNAFLILINNLILPSLDPKDYPYLEYYFDWVRKHNLNSTIEQDIFILKFKNLAKIN